MLGKTNSDLVENESATQDNSLLSKNESLQYTMQTDKFNAQNSKKSDDPLKELKKGLLMAAVTKSTE